MNKLHQLLALNKGIGQPLRAEQLNNASDNGAENSTTIYVYDVIVSDSYWGGIAAIDFVKLLNSVNTPEIHVRINSPGGDVFAAQAMALAIREHSARVVVHVDGIAASAATFLVIAADESYINASGSFMIHNGWTVAIGNKNDLLKTVDLLSKVDSAIANSYVVKTKKSLDEIVTLMDDETYFFGQEAVDNGFIDKVSAEPVKNKLEWDLSAYEKAGLKASEDKPNEPEKIDLSAHYRRLDAIKKLAA